jgi:uncharacterized protein YndB with AHSA1/START domain
MLNRPEPACLVIADISGYTSYIAGTELDHSQDILADLISTVVGALRPTFKLSKLEGDAAFVYVVAETVDGSMLQDMIEGCYFAFQRRLRDIRQASTCDCNACILIPTLDLKFVAHHGQVIRQRIMGRDELAGGDVIVAHRLLKNSITEALGFKAYAFYSEACVAAMGLAAPASAGLVAHAETYEHVGEVAGWVRDLDAAWRDEQERTRTIVTADQAIWTTVRTYEAPLQLVWEYGTSPARRPKWQAGVDAVFESNASGRRGVGTTNHCMHGKEAIVEEIVDWRPYDYVTERFQMPMPGVPKMTMTQLFEPVDGGTRVEVRIQKPRSAKDRAILEPLYAYLAEVFRTGEEALVEVLREDIAARAATTGAADEPDLPVSAARFLLEPAGPADVDSSAARASSG